MKKSLNEEKEKKQNEEDFYDSIYKLFKDFEKKNNIPVKDVLSKLNEKDEENDKKVNEENKSKINVETKSKKKEKSESIIEDEEEINEISKQEKEESDGLADSIDLNLKLDNLKTNDDINDSHVESISDALNLCLNKYGKVNIYYISKILKIDKEEVIDKLSNNIILDPTLFTGDIYSGYVLKDEYLSGNIQEKYQTALNSDTRLFHKNIEELKKILDEKSYLNDDIVVTLGTPWIPAHYIDEFISYLLNIPLRRLLENEWWPSAPDYYKTKHDTVTGTWECKLKNNWVVQNLALANSYYGSNDMNAVAIIEKTLNLRQIIAKKKKRNKSGVYIDVIDNKETTNLLQKQEMIINKFQEWIFDDIDRKRELLEIYKEKYTNIIPRKYDGSFLQFPKMNKDVNLYDYQRNAIFRILTTPNTLLAHNVGSGKTYIMIAAGMEMRRMGLSRRNMYVVPNNILSQWEMLFKYLYPESKVFVINSDNFKKENRKEVLMEVMASDYDAILITYSCFDRITISKNMMIDLLYDKLDRINNVLFDADNEEITSRLDKLSEKIQKEIAALERQKNDAEELDTIHFDDLNIDRLFVDEAHNYKNVDLQTKLTNVLGLNLKGSVKSTNMLNKIRSIQISHDGKGVIFATGTPITNSIAEAYNMQNYLQPEDLRKADISNFDDWINLFANSSPEFEIDVDTKKYRMATRLSKFYNLSILTRILSSVCDFHYSTNYTTLPKFNGYINILVKKTPQFQEFLDEISKRADAVRNKEVSRDEDNMLLITTDGRKAALDLRLYYKNADVSNECKIYKCAENVFNIYNKTKDKKLTQLVFCDTSVINHKDKGFNVYRELKNTLIKLGVNEKEIAFIHDYASDNRRLKLFSKINEGEIRILIGSTFKLGTGVNVQKKLIAIHHLDIPWRPSDMEQREGRILRQGNTNEEIYIFRYITEGSFDAYSYQLLETKQKFITKLLSNSLDTQESDDVSDTVLTYSEVKALAIGDDRIKTRVILANKISKLKVLQEKFLNERQKYQNEYRSLPNRISNLENAINNFKEDKENYENYLDTHKKLKASERKEIRLKVYNALRRYILKTEEKYITDYQGFKLIAPTNMTYESFSVIIEGKMRYTVYLNPYDDISLLRLVDSELDDFQKNIDKQLAQLNVLKDKKKFIEDELTKVSPYLDELLKTEDELFKIDEELGVNKNEEDDEK